MYSIKIKTIYTILFDGEGKVKWEEVFFLAPEKKLTKQWKRI